MAVIHTQIRVKDANNNYVPAYHRTSDKDVVIEQRSSLDHYYANLSLLLDALGDLAFRDREYSAGIDTAGIVALSNSTTSNDSTVAATSAAVKSLNDSKVSITGTENISGLKTFTSGVKVGDGTGYVSITYDSTTETIKFK